MLSASPANHHVSFLGLSCTERSVLVQEPGEDAGVEVLACSWNGDAHAAGIIWGFVDRNELCPSLRQFSLHLTMGVSHFGHSSVPVPCLLWLLCHVPSLPCHHPRSCFLLISLLLCLLLWGIYSPNQGCLMSFGGAAGSRQVGMLPACLHPHHAEEILCICWSRPGLLRFVCFGDIFSLNENPPPRLMQPEAIWEVQAHLLSSLSHLLTILQSWQEGNEGSRTQILLSDPLSQGGEFAHFLPNIPFSYGCLWMSPLPTHPLFSQVLCRKMGIFLSSTACSSNLSHSCQECVLQSPPSLLRFAALFAALFISSSAPKGLEFLWRGQCIRKSLAPKLAFIWYAFIVLEMWLVHPYYLFSSLQLISGNFLHNISELRSVSAGWF